jgi:hypothetical protein
VSEPWLAFAESDIDTDGVVRLHLPELAIDAPSVALLGDARPLFDVPRRLSRAPEHAVRVGGLPLLHAAQQGALGIAFADPPLDPRWSVDDHLVRSARLAGHRNREARELARNTLEAAELAAFGARRLGTLALPERRALGLLSATLPTPSGPTALFVEAPWDDLDERGTEFVLWVLKRASAGRTLLYSSARAPREGAARTWFDATEGHFAIERGELRAWQRPRDGTTRWSAVAAVRGAALVEALTERGHVANLQRDPRDPNGAARLIVDLPTELGSRPLIALSAELGAPIVELAMC